MGCTSSKVKSPRKQSKGTRGEKVKNVRLEQSTNQIMQSP